MKHNFHIKEKLRRLLRKSKSLRDPQLMHPEREWVVGLSGAIVLFIGVASASVYIYFKNQSINVEATKDDTAEVVYRESLVKEVLDTIKQREETLNSLNREDVPVVEVVEEIETATTTSEVEITAETVDATVR